MITNELININFIPIFTEKCNKISTKNNYFSFYVDKRSNKKKIKNSIEKLFNVKTLSIKTLNKKGKTKNFKGFSGKLKNKKKAYIKLQNNNKLDFSKVNV